MKNRRSIRLKEFDYSQTGAYSITLCTHNRICLFGEIEDGEMVLNDVGRVTEKYWIDIPNHFPHIQLKEYIVMPNHIRGILVIDTCRGPASPAPTKETVKRVFLAIRH